MRRVWLWRILSVLYVAVVCYLLFSEGDKLPKVPAWKLPFEMDKVAHFLMFFPYPVLAYKSMGVNRSNPGWLILGIWVFGCFLGALTEYVQSFTATRSMELADFLVECVSMLISSVALGIYLKKAENF